MGAHTGITHSLLRLYNHPLYRGVWHPICMRAVAAQHNEQAISSLSGQTPGTLYRRATTNWCMTSITRGAKACRLCPMSDRKKCSACVQKVHRGRQDRIKHPHEHQQTGALRHVAAGRGATTSATLVWNVLHTRSMPESFNTCFRDLLLYKRVARSNRQSVHIRKYSLTTSVPPMNL